MAAISSLAIGMVLGQRFKVLILAPTILLTLVITIGAGLARPEGAWSAGLSAAVAIVGLQIGYLLGSGIRHLRVPARASRLRAASLASSVSSPPRPAPCPLSGLPAIWENCLNCAPLARKDAHDIAPTLGGCNR